MAIEAAVAVVVLVLGLAGMTEIVLASYADDRMGRAARAAARALALDPTTDTCAAIRRELRLADAFDCDLSWSTKVFRGVSPSSLPDTLGSSDTEPTGDMVVVRIDSKPDGDPSATDDEQTVALGLARCELELCGEDSG